MSAYRTAGKRDPGDWLWMEILQRGPMSLTYQDWQAVEHTLPEAGRVAFKHLVQNLERQTKWVVERTAAMRDEAERIALIGQTMKKAGLRSYTDKDGATFVAAQSECPDSKGENQ